MNCTFAVDSRAHQAILFVGCNPQSMPHLPPSFQLPDIPYTNDVRLPTSLVSLSIYIGDGFNSTLHEQTISTVLKQAAVYPSTITRVEVTVQLRSSLGLKLANVLSHQFSQWLRSWDVPRERPHFHLTINYRRYGTETTIQVDHGRLTTGVVLPIDVVDNAVLDAILKLPNLEYLCLARPLMSRDHRYDPEQVVDVLRQKVHRLRELRHLTLSCLVYPEVLNHVLPMFAELPHCTSLRLFEWGLFAISQDHSHDRCREQVVSAIARGLRGYNHLRTLVLPSPQLRNLLQGVLETLEDLGTVRIGRDT